jgi:hypothetical protein
LHTVKQPLVRADEWFTLEIIARGNVLAILVNGNETARVEDATYARGHIALQAMSDAVTGVTTVVQFRKLEIREFSPTVGRGVGAPAVQGFVPLFNGHDLTGWSPTSGGKADWRVEGGAIVAGRDGYDPGERGYLITDRGDYADYRLRVEAQLDAKADSGVLLRLQPFPPEGVTHRERGYEVQMNCEARGTNQTGGLFVSPPVSGPFVAYRQERALAPANEWFTLEVTVQGGRITTRVDGKASADYTDPVRHFARGHIGLQYARGVVRVRKVEIQELPAKAAELDREADARAIGLGGDVETADQSCLNRTPGDRVTESEKEMAPGGGRVEI